MATASQLIAAYQKSVAGAPRAKAGVILSESAIAKLPVGTRFRMLTQTTWEVGDNGKPKILESRLIQRERI
jgi:hypothetical protein